MSKVLAIHLLAKWQHVAILQLGQMSKALVIALLLLLVFAQKTNPTSPPIGSPRRSDADFSH